MGACAKLRSSRRGIEREPESQKAVGHSLPLKVQFPYDEVGKNQIYKDQWDFLQLGKTEAGRQQCFPII